MIKTSPTLAETLRQQIINALESGLWRAGRKLPSIREMAAEMTVDPRVVAEAYRVLAEDGLVELKSRSGAYIAEAARPVRSAVSPSEPWLMDLLAEGVTRELPIPDMGEWLRRSTATIRLTAFVVAPTVDQVQGLRRELRAYYGFEASGETLESLESLAELPPLLRRADILITTEGAVDTCRQIVEPIGIPCIAVSVRFDLIGPAWQRLMQSPTYIVVTDERFETMLRTFLASRREAREIKVLVVGRDDLGRIPEDAVVYVTQSSREKLGAQQLNGSVLPPTRLLSGESSRELIKFNVEANLAAMRALPRWDETAPELISAAAQ
ncbi:MAG: GntR family transcriptional regulator [Gemmatimonadaceae bacterium]|nr:GntR family transcriptional regulator [Gemmatimonadaceae bacterium]